MLEKLTRIARLLDFYGPLLTPKQREWLELHYYHDFSLREIASASGVSRQAVHDGIQRAEKLLEGYESKLGFLARYQVEKEKLEEVARSLEFYSQGGGEELLRRSIKIVDELLNLPEGNFGRG
ncbi:MAG: uncharacterized protein PWP65_180 [Clostridia bacterium]|nr:uncharacterized protein [Clostridia bacterium]